MFIELRDIGTHIGPDNTIAKTAEGKRAMVRVDCILKLEESDVSEKAGLEETKIPATRITLNTHSGNATIKVRGTMEGVMARIEEASLNQNVAIPFMQSPPNKTDS